MKKLRILPGAASVIALTVAIGFVDGRREAESETPSRCSVTLVSTMSQIEETGFIPDKQIDIKPDNPAYLVQIRRQNATADVLIDAVSGRVLS